MHPDYKQFFTIINNSHPLVQYFSCITFQSTLWLNTQQSNIHVHLRTWSCASKVRSLLLMILVPRYINSNTFIHLILFVYKSHLVSCSLHYVYSLCIGLLAINYVCLFTLHKSMIQSHIIQFNSIQKYQVLFFSFR